MAEELRLRAAARQAGCRLIYSEDLQHGQVLDGVAIQNPFLPLDGRAP
jgi:predicted nucleic acid-binding protein